MLSKRVLIVDDALDFGRMLQATLSIIDGGRVQTTLVPSAEEALLELSRLAPDLVVSDLRLPGISGFDLIRKIRARAGSVKVVIVTGLQDPSLMGESIRAGADRFFVKPLSTNDFVAAIQQLLFPDEQPSILASNPSPEPVATPALPVTPEPAVASPSQPAVSEPAAVKAASLDLLDTARTNLGARSLFLLDAGGSALFASGEALEADLQAGAVPTALAALKAGQALADVLDPLRKETVLAVKGRSADWVLTPVDDRALLIALPTGLGALRLPLAFEAALALRAELLTALAPVPSAEALVPVVEPLQPVAAAPAPASAVAPVVEVAPEKEFDLGDLADLFSNPPANLLQNDVSAFWEQAVGDGSAEPPSESTLSYEEAVRMGLTGGAGGV